MSRGHLLLLLSRLFSSILSTTSVTFKCTTLTTCQSMIGYVSPNFTNPSFLKDRFGVDSLSSLLKFNNWSTSDASRPIPANSAVRIPFTCTCTNRTGSGVSEGKPVYTVVEDNTLSDIAETIFGGFVTYQEIATVNGISDANKIDIGQHLWIPLPCSCDAVDGATVIHLAHVVASGSSLSQIAAEFETTEAVLSNLNSETLRDAKYLNAGQILDVPIKGDDKSRSALLSRGEVAGICIPILAYICVFMICLVRKLSSDNFIFFRKKKTNDVRKVEEFLENCDVLVLKRYRYSELKKITNSFTNNLGQGGYGSVFKGKLNDGRLVAVKVLNNSKGSNGEEFINEVASIGRTCHLNIVALLGFCSEGSKRALVYEYMSKGSLDKIIFSADHLGTSYVLDIQKLFQIAVGIARGLEYLHRGCSTRIVHFDIKPHNILLDDGLCPKISDFGLAKLCPQQKSTFSMLDARGTMGYTAPELFCRNIGGVSYKSDVYSYGMMVLEMVGGRKNIDAEVENISQIYFPHWIYKHIELRESLDMLGFTTKEEEEIARKMILVGLWCIQTDPKNRPSMSEVVGMLEGSLGSLQMPPKPYLSSP